MRSTAGLYTMLGVLALAVAALVIVVVTRAVRRSAARRAERAREVAVQNARWRSDWYLDVSGDWVIRIVQEPETEGFRLIQDSKILARVPQDADVEFHTAKLEADRVAARYNDAIDARRG